MSQENKTSKRYLVLCVREIDFFFWEITFLWHGYEGDNSLHSDKTNIPPPKLFHVSNTSTYF